MKRKLRDKGEEGKSAVVTWQGAQEDPHFVRLEQIYVGGSLHIADKDGAARAGVPPAHA